MLGFKKRQQVITDRGAIELSKVRVGDKILAPNGFNVVEEVEKFSVADKNYLLSINGEYYHPDQSLMVNGRVEHAFAVVAGDFLTDEKGNQVVVREVVRVNPRFGEYKFTKLIISGDHLFFLNGNVAHNASRFWVGGTGTWDATTTHWSASTGGASGASSPTSSDDATFDASSGGGTVTPGASRQCANLSFSGFTGTYVTSTAVSIFGNFTAGTTVTFSGTASGFFNFSATTTGKTVTTNGKTMPGCTFNGAGGGWTLQDDLTIDTTTFGQGAVSHTAGTLNTNGKTVTCESFGGFSGSTRTLTLGASTINCTAMNASNITGLTFNANTSTINVTPNSTGAIWQSGNLTYNNVVITLPSTGITTYTDLSASTFANLTIAVSSGSRGIAISLSGTLTVTGTFSANGPSQNERVRLYSSVQGTARTISAAIVSISNVDFRDITGAGAGTWSGSSIGNALGNSGITTTTPTTRYWVGNGGNWNDSTHWSTSTGGSTGASMPLPQDAVIFDSNSFSSGAQTVSGNNVKILGGSIDSSAVTNSPSIAPTSNSELYGSLNLGAASHSGNVGIYGRSSPTISSHGNNCFGIIVNTFGSTLTLNDAANFNGTFVATLGTFAPGGFNITSTSATFNGATASLGSITWTLTGTSTIWSYSSGSVTASSVTLYSNNTSNTLTVIGGGGLTYGTLWFDRGASTGANNIQGTSTYGTIKDTGTAAHNIVFPNVTTTVTNFNVTGSAGNLISLTRTGASGTFTLSAASGLINCDWLSISNSTATGGASWFAGANSTNGGGNTGWIFSAGILFPSVSDSITVDDSSVTVAIQTGISVVVNDSIAVIDAATMQLVNLIPVSDSITVTDVPTTLMVDSINVFDSIAIAEAVQMQGVLFVSVNDTVAVTDAPTLQIVDQGAVVNDTITVSEFVALQIVDSISVNDSIAVTDVPTVAPLLIAFSVSDSIAVTDAPTIEIIDQGAVVFDAITVSEFVQMQLVSPLSVFDAVTVTENVALKVVDFISVSDSITVAESVTLQIVEEGAVVNDTIAVNEFVQMQLVDFISVSDTVTVTDSVTTTEPFVVVSVSDSITVGEAVTLVLIQQGDVVSDTIVVSESVTIEIIGYASVSDTVAVTDVPSIVEVNLISVNDSIGVTENVTMLIATRTFYWVGGTGNWDATSTHWALSSGGAGSQGVPTSADNVIFDGNSGGGTVTIQTAVAVCASFNASAFTGNITQSQNFNIGNATAGDFILGSGMTFTWVSGAIKLVTTKASASNIDLAGKTVGNFTINGNGASFVLQNDILASGALAFSGGAVDFNGYNATADHLSNGNTLTRSVNMRGGSITLTGTGAIFDAPAGTLTFLWTTGAKFVIANTSITAKTFAGGTNITYPTIQVSGAASAGTVTFSGAFTCNAFSFDPNANILFTSATTYTATAFFATGSLGNPITIAATTPTSAAIISIPTGIISCDWLVLTDNHATGGATFYAGGNSTNGGNTTGWIFAGAPLGINIVDTIAVTDVPTVVIVDLINVSDAIAVTDAPQMQEVNSVSVFDAVVISESVTLEIIEQGAAVSDTISVLESVTLKILDFVSVSDTVTVSESVVVEIIEQGDTVFDTITITESVNIQLVSAPNVSDTVVVSEFVKMQEVFLISVNDSIAVSEFVKLQIISSNVVFDTVVVGESVQMQEVFFVSVSDTVNVIDTATPSEVLYISVSDTVAVTDAPQMSILSHFSVADTVVVTESVVVAVNTHISVFDTVTVTESVSLNVQIHIVVEDTIVVQEFVRAGIFIPIVAFEGTVKLGWKFAGYTVVGYPDQNNVVSQALNKTIDLTL